MQRFIERASKTLGLASAVVTVSDLMQPIAPFAAYVIFVSLVSLLAFSFGKLIKREWGEPLSVCMLFSGGLLILSSALYFVQNSNGDSKGRGILAAEFSTIEALQADLGLINQSLKDIKGAIYENTKVVEKGKKEISPDPMKELANKGLPWKYEAFLESMYNKQYDLVELYAAGGMKLRSDDLSAYLNSLHDADNSSILLRHKSFVVGGGCPDIEKSIKFYLEHLADRQKTKILKYACDSGKLEAAIDQALAREEARVNQNKEFNRNRESIVGDCISRLGGLALEYYSNKYFKQYSGFGNVVINDAAEEAVARELYFSVMAARYDDLARDSYIKGLARDKCDSVNSQRLVDTKMIDELIWLRKALL